MYVRRWQSQSNKTTYVCMRGESPSSVVGCFGKHLSPSTYIHKYVTKSTSGMM